jgi:DNA-binding transcriptional regulator YdaS (Cro superfamily)
MESLKYLDRCRPLTPTGSDYALAKLLGISETAINQYRSKARVMDDFACLRVSQVLGVALEEIVAAANYDREPDEKKKLEWAKHLKKLAPLFVLPLCLCVFVGSLGTGQGHNSACDLLQIMRAAVRRITRQAFAHFPALRAPSAPRWRGLALA